LHVDDFKFPNAYDWACFDILWNMSVNLHFVKKNRAPIELHLRAIG